MNSLAKQVVASGGTGGGTQSKNIKVIARFRPLNKVESELIDSGVGSKCAHFVDEKSVAMKPETEKLYTLDRIFNSESKQEEIFEFAGRETITDILDGFNGTIFAYGQTSSGKTHTMFGEMHSEDLKGIIPRSTQQIFDAIEACEDDVEFEIGCSMLEIYRENLFDLLNNRSSDLKIKEDPRKGIVIANLEQQFVENEEELMELLDTGAQSKKVASTRMNEHSSRSHTLFFIEII
jgi:kinesin family protein 5